MQIIFVLFIASLPFYFLWEYSSTLSIILLLCLGNWVVFSRIKKQKKEEELNNVIANMTPEERKKYNEKLEYEKAQIAQAIFKDAYGEINPALICPHCHNKDLVYVKRNLKQIITTGQIGGVLKANTKTTTQKWVTTHHCAHCKTTWDI